ncbi:hypothetical protein ACFFLM_18985 [Deinococcus oregonensis]|uniref:Uncharacterized protein n=1 Tax=Deinococcus oregonensis TaxID=1805970 RepID=A0ABV6B583_9DEIO
MALPKKMAGYRPIFHGGKRYRWRLCYLATTAVTVIHEQHSAAALIIQLPEYQDPWLLTDARQSLSMPAVTPVFVARAIAFAQTQGREPAQQRKRFEMTWEAAEFRTLTPQLTSK